MPINLEDAIKDATALLKENGITDEAEIHKLATKLVKKAVQNALEAEPNLTYSKKVKKTIEKEGDIDVSK